MNRVLREDEAGTTEMHNKHHFDIRNIKIFWGGAQPPPKSHPLGAFGAWTPVPLSDGLDTCPCKILDPPLSYGSNFYSIFTKFCTVVRGPESKIEFVWSENLMILSPYFGYCGPLIRSRISAFNWHENHRPCMNLNGYYAVCYKIDDFCVVKKPYAFWK